MSQIKCKMCGGTLDIEPKQNIIECDYCGTKQTVPNIDDEKRRNLHNRANTLRLSCSFDKAIVTYENLIEEFPKDAEAHWGLVLCRYGIEYVDDPKTKKKIPTCHRTQYKAIFDDIDYKAAIQHSDVLARALYQKEAEEINKIQKGILAISQKEAPYDIFICYKESDSSGQRTRDSVIAQEIYDTLTDKQYKVFFAKITLESKLGSQYEPYIFSALHSAKVMLVIGTKPEYFNAPWVKNEWARYLELLGENKKFIIPCYRDMDVYELPEELLSFQSQDMNKLGFIQDLIRGIDKIFDRRKPEEIKTYAQPVYQNGVNVTALIKRCEILIADQNFDKAETLIDEVLNNDPTNAKAYVLLLLMELGMLKEEDLSTYHTPLDSFGNFQKAFEFADNNYRQVLAGYNDDIKGRIRQANLSSIYKSGTIAMENKLYNEAISMFESILDYEDAAEKLEYCKTQIFESLYVLANELFNKQYYAVAIEKFKEIIDYKNSRELLEECEFNINEISYQSAKSLINNKKYGEAIDELNKIIGHKDSADLIEICETMLLKDKTAKYQTADLYVQNREYNEAISIFASLGNFEDSQERVEITKDLIKKYEIYEKAITIAKTHKIGDLVEAVKMLKSVDQYLDAPQLVEEYQILIDELKTKKALQTNKINHFLKFFIPAVALVIIMILLTFILFIPSGKYNKGIKYLENQQYEQAEEVFKNLKFRDSKSQLKLIDAYIYCEDGEYDNVIKIVCSLGGKVNITYDADGGVLKDNKSQETIITNTTIDHTATKPGYKFDGWELADYKISNKTKKYNFNLTLKAKWVIDEYEIEYNLNGGSVAGELVESYNKDDQFTLPTPTKKGYTFKGWKNNKTNTTSQSVTISKGTSGDLSFSALFEANEYVITFDANGGTSLTSVKVTFDSTYSLPIPTRNYYRFDGWYYDDVKLQSGSIYNFEGNIKAKAKWVPEEYNITYNLDGGVNNENNPLTYNCETNMILSSPTKEGYTFVGWSEGTSTEVSKEYVLKNNNPTVISLTAHWEANTYTIKFNANGGTNSTTSKVVTFDSSYTLPTPTRSYYKFAGWYYNDTKLTGTKYNIAEDITATAKWTPISYSISYNLNGGKNSSSNPSSYTCETNMTLSSPTRTGYTFLGWAEGTSSSYTNPYVLRDSTPANLTLTAKWKANTYTISFVTNGGNSISKMTVTYDKSFTLPTPTKEGYVFDCWTLTNSSTGTVLNSGVWTKTKNTTIYAQWKPLKTIEDFKTEILNLVNNYSSSTGVTTTSKYFAGTSDENLKKALSNSSILNDYQWLFEYALDVVKEAGTSNPSIKRVVLSGTSAGYAYDNIINLLNDLIEGDTTAINSSNVDGRCFLKEFIHEIINYGEESKALTKYTQFVIDFSLESNEEEFLDIYAKICDQR